MDDASMGTGPTFAMFMYGATCIALTTCACMGIPWTEESLGALIFLSGLPLLWLNERRAARMTALILHALRQSRGVSAETVDPSLEGELLMVSGPLRAEGFGNTKGIASAPPAEGMQTKQAESLVLQRFGVEAPSGSVAVRARIECYGNPHGCTCSDGSWKESGVEVRSEETRASEVYIGALLLRDDRFMDLRNCWWGFQPEISERLMLVINGEKDAWEEELDTMGAQHASNCIGCCPCCAKTITSAARRFLANPLPFPGERPQVEDDGNNGMILYYPRGGGIPRRPRLGDVRVSFVHIPGGSSQQIFTACGVQRMAGLEPFRFKGPPPRGIAMGKTSPDSFNLGQNGEQALYGDDAQAMSPYNNGLVTPRRDMTPDEEKALIQKQGAQEQPNCFARLWLIQMVLSIASDAWRTILHKAAPERLLFVTPGSLGRCSFFMRADGEDLFMAWRIRVLGFMVMFAGCEIAFFKSEALLTLIPMLGPILANGLWLVATVGAAGFTAATISLASLFYRPLSAIVYLGCAGALFCCVLGHTTVLVTLGIVALCMLLLAALLLVHLILPC